MPVDGGDYGRGETVDGPDEAMRQLSETGSLAYDDLWNLRPCDPRESLRQPCRE